MPEWVEYDWIASFDAGLFSSSRYQDQVARAKKPFKEMHGHVVFAELWHCCFGVFQIIKSYQIRDFGGRVSCVRKSNHGYFNCTFMDDYSNQYLWNELQQLLDENTQGHG